MSESLWPRALQHTRLLCPTLFRVRSNSCPLSWWCYLNIWSSATRFSFCLQFFLASRSFPVSRLFASGGQSIGTSASATVLPMLFRVDFLLDWLVWLDLLQSKGLSRVKILFMLLYRLCLKKILLSSNIPFTLYCISLCWAYFHSDRQHQFTHLYINHPFESTQKSFTYLKIPHHYIYTSFLHHPPLYSFDMCRGPKWISSSISPP